MSLHVFRAVALKVMWATAQKGFGYQVAKIIAIYYGCTERNIFILEIPLITIFLQYWIIQTPLLENPIFADVFENLFLNVPVKLMHKY